MAKKKAKSAAIPTNALDAARKLRDQFRDKGEFNVTDYHAALVETLRDFRSEAFGSFVDRVADLIDNDADTPLNEKLRPRQMLLWETEGEYKLGDNRRIAKTKATWQHVQESLKIAKENADAVWTSYEWRKDEAERLKPYWNKPGVVKDEAIAEYQKEHPAEAVA